MKKLIVLLIVLNLLSCKDRETIQTENTPTTDTVSKSDTTKTNTPNLIIVPGKKISSIGIGQTTQNLTSLGKPDFSDNAMGKGWLIWYDDPKDTAKRQAERMIFTTYKNSEMKEKIVAEIRTNSVDFKTESGLGVGTNFEIIQKEFAQIKEFAKYKNQRTGKDIFIYDVPGSGIAFEFISYEGEYAKCTAVIVYDKNQTLNTDYILFLPERETPNGE